MAWATAGIGEEGRHTEELGLAKVGWSSSSRVEPVAGSSLEPESRRLGAEPRVEPGIEGPVGFVSGSILAMSGLSVTIDCITDGCLEHDFIMLCLKSGCHESVC